MAAQYIPIKRVSSLDVPITAEKLDGSLFTTENQAHEFIISVRKNGVKQTVTGGVTGKFIRANGTTIFLQGSISNGDAVVRLHQDCYNVQGRFTFNIFNSQNGVTTCIYSAVGKIDLGSTETVIDAGDVVPDVTDVIAAQETMKQELADAVSRTNSAIAGIQPQIDSSVSGMQSTINSSVSSMQNTINSAVTTMQSRTDTAVQSANDAATAANQAADAANQAAQAGDSKFVRYDAAQGLTDGQKGTARDNIQAATSVGTEPELIAGTAEQLMSDETVMNAGPYKFRRTAGTGNRAYLDKIVGGTVALNQLLTNGDFSDGATGWTAIKSELAVDSGVATVTITQLSSNAYGNRIYVQFKNPKTVMGHKYYVSFVAKTPKTGSISVYASNSNESNIFDVSTRAINKANEYASYGFVLNAIRSPEAYTRLYIGIDNSEGNGYAVGDTFNIKNIQLIDLTQMFGSAVADHVYSLEQAIPGAEWFRNLFPAEYYPYSEGELISVSGLSEHKTVGFNIWDEEWEKGYYSSGKKVASTNSVCCKNLIPVIPGEQYFVQYPGGFNLYYCYFDANRNPVVVTGMDNAWRFVITSAGQITIPSNVHYLAFSLGAAYGTVYKNDICINLSDPSRNGEYEPYAGHSNPLDSSLTLRGIPKLSADNQVYWDGDEYTPDGKVNRRYGIVDLGTLDWYKQTVSSGVYFHTNYTSMKKPTGNRVQPLLCMKYGAIYDGRSFENVPDKSIYTALVDSASRLCIVDSAYTAPADLKDSLSGVYLAYELATPTEETALAYEQFEIVDPSGTEEFVSDSIVPVGHETRYMADLKSRLENLPDIATNDGTYAIKQTNGKMELTKLPFVSDIVESVSGSVASFSDGADGAPMKSLIAHIEHVQNLNGYDHPWPAGGSKNLLDESKMTEQSSWQDLPIALSAGTYTMSTDIPETSALKVFAKLSNDSSSTSQPVYSGKSVTFTLAEGGTFAVSYKRDSGTDLFANYHTQVEAGNTATDYIPYSNICPISGWTRAKVTRTGKNLLGGDALELAIQKGATDWNNYPADRRIRFSGASDTKPPFSNGLKFKENTQYTFIMTFYKTNIKQSNMIVRYTDGGYDYIPDHSSDLSTKETLVLVTRAGKTISRFEKVNAGGYTHLYYDESGIFEGVLTADDFVPYEGESYDIEFPSEAGTVYGGILDVVSGVLTVDMAKVDLGTLTWKYNSVARHTYFFATLANPKRSASGTTKANLACDRYGNDTGNHVYANTTDKTIAIPADNDMAMIYDTAYTDANTFKTAMSGVQLVYELAAPFTYQLTPQEVRTLLGQNNIWADTGNVDVTYQADTKLYIDNKISELQALVLENVGG